MIGKSQFLAITIACSLAGCVSPTYVDKGRGEKGFVGYNEVKFQVYDAFKKTPPICVALLPFKQSSNSGTIKPDDISKVRISLYAHLSTHSNRLPKLERVDHVLNEVGGDIKAVGERMKCDAVLQGEVTEYGTIFAGVYSRVAVGARFKMTRASNGELLWDADHTASSHGGSVILDPVGVAFGVIDAVVNVRDEQILRVTDDLTRRVVSTIPDTAVAALDDPVDEPPNPIKPEPKEDDLILGERLLQSGDHTGALRAAERACAADSKRADAWFLKAQFALSWHGNFE